MKFSNFLSKTKRNAPKNTEAISHSLMIQAGLIQQIESGLYAWAPMGLRILRNFENIIREELEELGASEVILPIIQKSDIWEQSGRLDSYGSEMLRIEDRHGKQLIFSPTAEEAFTVFFRDYGTTIKDLGKPIYQINWKFRDEIRPRNGVIRSKEFLMKDAYSFDVNQEISTQTYERFMECYTKIFNRIGVDFKIIEADSGVIGGTSHEFQIEGIEVGHIFSFGQKYSEKLNLTLDSKEGKIFPFMGSYGIGLSRLVAAYIESNNDSKGMIWSEQLAPFSHIIIPMTNNSIQLASKFYSKLKSEKVKVLLDDRDIRGGEKLKDAELLGIPNICIFGDKSVSNNTYDHKSRIDDKTKTIII
jgi:prolyl-tRNA synthetase